MDQTSTRPRRNSGFTILEVMIALAIVGILMGLAAPNFRDAMMNVRISAQTNDLMSDLALARSEALKRNLPVFLCSSVDGLTCGGEWKDGWLLFVDRDNNARFDSTTDFVMKARRAAEGKNSIVAIVAAQPVTSVSYRPTGRVGGGAEVDFSICDSRATPNNGRNVKITVTGRPKATPKTCTS